MTKICYRSSCNISLSQGLSEVCVLSDSNTVLDDIALLSLFGESTLYTTTRLYSKNSITMLNELVSVSVVLPNKGERNSYILRHDTVRCSDSCSHHKASSSLNHSELRFSLTVSKNILVLLQKVNIIQTHLPSLSIPLSRCGLPHYLLSHGGNRQILRLTCGQVSESLSKHDAVINKLQLATGSPAAQNSLV